MGYDVFVSYSRAADGQLAPAVQSGLQRLAKPWWRRRALRVFRDDTGLTANPHMWNSIEAALLESSWFVMMGSPDATSSRWVGQEVAAWLEHKGADRILIVKTDGTITWDHARQDFAPASTAIPAALIEHVRFGTSPR